MIILLSVLTFHQPKPYHHEVEVEVLSIERIYPKPIYVYDHKYVPGIGGVIEYRRKVQYNYTMLRVMILPECDIREYKITGSILRRQVWKLREEKYLKLGFAGKYVRKVGAIDE